MNQSSNRPNIILLMDDQHRWDALGCVNPLVQTPTLDRLAAAGVRFGQATCQAPACIPSRYSLMTGLYPSQVGVRTNGDKLSDAEMPRPTIAQHLAAAGYQTAGFGKTHWRAPGCSTRGFQVRAIGQPRNGPLYERRATMMSDRNPEGLAAYFAETDPYGGGEENVAGYIGCTSRVPAEDHRDGWVTEQCLDFLESGRDPTRPLFLYLSFLKPHAGLNVPPGFEALYDLAEIPDMPNPDWPEDQPRHTQRSDPRMPYFRDAAPEVRRRTVLRYWANCAWIDSMFGRVLDKLQTKGLLGDSLILYHSDHGEMLGEHYFRFTKYCLYESSVRVPLILAGSRVPPALRNTVDSRPTELVDLLPTILETAGIDLPPELVGRSLLGPPGRRGAFCEFHRGAYPYQAPAYMWRTETAKLILYFPAEVDQPLAQLDRVEGELYDLEVDPHEWHNRYHDPAYAGLRESLTRELLMHLATIWSTYPRPTSNR